MLSLFDSGDEIKLMHWAGKNLFPNLFSVLASEINSKELGDNIPEFRFELNLRESLCELHCCLQQCGEDFGQNQFWKFLSLFESFEFFCSRNMEYYHENPCQYVFFQKRRSIVFQICMCVLWDSLQCGLSSKDWSRNDVDSICPENFDALVPYQEYESLILEVFSNESVVKQYGSMESAEMDRETLTRDLTRFNQGVVSVDKALYFLQCSHSFGMFRQSMVTFLCSYETMFLPIPLMKTIVLTNKRLKIRTSNSSKLVDLTNDSNTENLHVTEIKEEKYVSINSPKRINIRVNRRPEVKDPPKGRRVVVENRQTVTRAVWEVEETNALIAAMQDIGLGQWVKILDSDEYGCSLKNKNNEQLKDKARNMEKNKMITVFRRK